MTDPSSSDPAASSPAIDGPLGQSSWILDHWSREVLFTPVARATWVEPDRRPLPW